MENYKIVKYSEIGKIRSGKRLPKGYTVSEQRSNNKYIRVRDINSGSIDSSIVQYITDEAASKLERYRVKTRDVIISVVGTVGAIAQIDESLNGAYLTENCDNLQVDESLCLKDYLKYYLLSDDGNKEIVANTVGSTQPKLPIYGIENFNIKLPSIDNQKRIIKLLNSISKKIKLNNEINNNLQELAKSIYYEKFKDKSNNGKLKDILDLYRKNVKNKDLSLKYFPVDVLPMNYLITKKGKPNEEAQSSLVEFKKYDILVGAMRVYFHRVCLAAEDGITRTTTFVLRPKNNDYLYYSLITLDKDDFIKYANDGSKGSTMPYAVWDNNCNEYEIYIPSTTEAKEFNELVKPLFEIQIINEKNNRDLEQLRSILLPKLINGEIDVENIEI